MQKETGENRGEACSGWLPRLGSWVRIPSPAPVRSGDVGASVQDRGGLDVAECAAFADRLPNVVATGIGPGPNRSTVRSVLPQPDGDPHQGQVVDAPRCAPRTCPAHRAAPPIVLIKRLRRTLTFRAVLSATSSVTPECARSRADPRAGCRRARCRRHATGRCRARSQGRDRFRPRPRSDCANRRAAGRA